MTFHIKPRIKCPVDGCNLAVALNGFCRNHDARMKKYGDPLGGIGRGERMAWLLARVKHESDECLIWPFSIKENGYPRVSNGRKRIYAHSEMCRLAHGDRPQKFQAAHSCGNRACVNPRHLRWASVRDNLLDRVGHGTVNNGPRNGRAKLCEADVAEILAAASRGIFHRKIAKMHGVSRQTVSDIVSGRRWGWMCAQAFK